MVRFALASLVLFTLSGTVAARPFEAYYSGTSAPIGADANGDGVPSSVSSSRGTTRRFRAFTTQSVSELAAWDGGYRKSAPDWDARLEWTAYSEVWTFASLDQIYLALSPDAESYLCIRQDGTWYAVFHGVVTGGSGDFAAVRGTLTATAEGRDLPNPAGHSVFKGTISGDLE
jgi:hypothetical protein